MAFWQIVTKMYRSPVEHFDLLVNLSIFVKRSVLSMENRNGLFEGLDLRLGFFR